jgi:glucans biosynthesis protein C
MDSENTRPVGATGSDFDRQHYIDWLRLGAVFLLFFFHSARVFDPSKNFYVQNIPKSDIIYHIFIRMLDPWHMSLFFLLAGASTCYALRKRTGGKYSRERFKRLFIPFVFGVMVLIPPQSYLGLLNHSNYSGSFFHWLPDFFTLQEDDPDGYFMGGYTWGHLWFIFHLFVYSLIALPLFLYFNRESGRGWINRLASAFTHPLVFLLLFPLVLVLLSEFPDVGGGNPIWYITFFISGFIFMADPRFIEAIDRKRRLLLIVGPMMLVFLTICSYESWPSRFPDWFDVIVDRYYAFISWFTILAVLAYGKRLLNFTNRLLNYFAEASYPLYILHQTVIVIIAYYLVQTDIAVAIKYVTLVACSFVSSVLVYDILVKRNTVTRFLFGIRPRRRVGSM